MVSFLSVPIIACDPFSTRSIIAAYKAKGPLKQDDLRRRREEQQVEIRRQKREENISKRRNFLPSAGTDSDEEVGGGVWDPPVCTHPSIRCLSDSHFNSLPRK